MKHRLLVVVAVAASAVPILGAQGGSGPANPAIEMEGYLRVSALAAEHRWSRRLSEDQFVRLSRERGTVVLDARSREKYEVLHVRGAINLSFPAITFESLARAIPDKGTRILITTRSRVSYFMNRFRKMGFIHYNGGLQVHRALITVVLRD